MRQSKRPRNSFIYLMAKRQLKSIRNLHANDPDFFGKYHKEIGGCYDVFRQSGYIQFCRTRLISFSRM